MDFGLIEGIDGGSTSMVVAPSFCHIPSYMLSMLLHAKGTEKFMEESDVLVGFVQMLSIYYAQHLENALAASYLQR